MVNTIIGLTFDEKQIVIYALDDKFKVLKDIEDETQNDICSIRLAFKKMTPAAKHDNEAFIAKLSAKTANNVFYKILTCEQIP